MMDWNEIIELSASVVTAIGVGIAAYQIWQAKKQSRTSFEDDFARQYREIIHCGCVLLLLENHNYQVL
jgi:hypothetical protein